MKIPVISLWRVWTPGSLEMALKLFLHEIGCMGPGWMAEAPSRRGTPGTWRGSSRNPDQLAVAGQGPSPEGWWTLLGGWWWWFCLAVSSPSLTFPLFCWFPTLGHEETFVTKVLFVCQNSIESFRSQENKIGMDDKQNSDYRKKMTVQLWKIFYWRKQTPIILWKNGNWLKGLSRDILYLSWEPLCTDTHWVQPKTFC